ncbi:hypothetical protein A9Q87_10225 [Flavobacteriales bacterium 34_180_T64]|nr:hypothetical protein A9Q87_10225 [Flavobacteriales bacterium 34_180_T64]
MKKNINLLLVLFFLISSYASALTVIDVTNTDDSGTGSLRAAIIQANTGPVDTYDIQFNAVLDGQTLTLLSNLPNIMVDMTITGLAGGGITISGAGSFTMFTVAASKTLTVSGLTLTNNTTGNGNVFYGNAANLVASDMVVTGITNNYAFYSQNSGSSINFTNSTFTSNSAYVFGSDHGQTPSTTSNIETDYTNRITVTGSTFSSNTGKIFRTERFVKIDACNFINNTNVIAEFRGLNRYQVLNSTFTNNSYAGSMFSFTSNAPGEPYLSGLGANNHLFDGNTFTGNSGTIVNPGNSGWEAKTTISNNIFSNNNAKWSGSPAVITGNTYDDLIASVSHDVDTNRMVVIMNTAVFNTNGGSGALEANDFEFSLSGGTATLGSTVPTSISNSGNTYYLGLNISGTINGAELLSVDPIIDSIYDASANKAGALQANGSSNLVVPVTLVTKYGEIATSNANTVNANGALGTGGGVDENGKTTVIIED